MITCEGRKCYTTLWFKPVFLKNSTSFFLFGCAGSFCSTQALSSCTWVFSLVAANRGDTLVVVRRSQGPLSFWSTCSRAHRLQQLWLTGLAAPEHVGLNPCPLHWQADSLKTRQTERSLSSVFQWTCVSGCDFHKCLFASPFPLGETGRLNGARVG